MEPSRNYRLGPLTYTTETDMGEENRQLEFINIIQNVPFGKWKILIKLIKKTFIVGISKQQRHLLCSSTGQKVSKTRGEVSEFLRKRCMNFLFFLKVGMGCGKHHLRLSSAFHFPSLCLRTAKHTTYIF